MDDDQSSIHSDDSVNSPLHEIPDMTFCLQLKPLGKLKEAIIALCNLNVNPQGMALIEVGRGENEFRLAVRDQKSEVWMFLDLNTRSLSLTHFYCTRPFEKKMVSLFKILSLIFQHFRHDDAINIFHLHGSSQLSFIFGNDPFSIFNVDIVDASNFQRPPDTIYHCCVATLRTKEFNKILPFMLTEQGECRAIRVEMTDKAVSFQIGGRNWRLEYAKRAKKSGMSPGQIHFVWMQWPHVELLQKVCGMVKWFYIAFVTDPPNSIMFQFGRLVFLREVTGTFLNHEPLSVKLVV